MLLYEDSSDFLKKTCKPLQDLQKQFYILYYFNLVFCFLFLL